MQNLRLVFLLTQLLVYCTVSLSESLGNDDVSPGEKNTPDNDAWTRQGELGPLPQRISNSLPLSDQSNQSDWVSYAPLTDEFSETSLNKSKWLPNHLKWKGRKPAWFSSDNVTVSAGQLQLTMRREEPPESLRTQGFHTYSSAAVHSLERVKYGYFEVRAQPMNSAGSSSFWFAGSGGNWRTEIDVFEIGGKADRFEHRYNMNLHVFESPTSKKHWNVGDHWIAPWRLADAFHTYGLEWNDQELIYYVDGVAVRRVENTHWHQPIYMIFDSETMPDWLGMPEMKDLPSTYRIDYVRSWKSRKQTATKQRADAVGVSQK